MDMVKRSHPVEVGCAVNERSHLVSDCYSFLSDKVAINFDV
jgi:hypothetical protein